MRIVAGLGNPGAEYDASRHNIGFMVVRALADRWNVTLRRSATALEGIAHFAGEEVRLLLPQTYMNRSGAALAGVFDGAPEGHLVVVHDDVDLPEGTVRVRARGGSGGHRGVSSVIETCGPEFVRVRVGVGRPPQGSDTADFVLAEIPADTWGSFRSGIELAADAIECVLADGVATAMNRFNRKVTPPGE